MSRYTVLSSTAFLLAAALAVPSLAYARELSGKERSASKSGFIEAIWRALPEVRDLAKAAWDEAGSSLDPFGNPQPDAGSSLDPFGGSGS